MAFAFLPYDPSESTPMTCAFAGPLFDRAFYYLRHGETETNRLGLITGSTDIALNARGREQARAAAELVKALEVDAIYASPLQRARETAQCIAVATGLPVTLVPGIAERCFGELEGKPRGLLVRHMTPPGGESLSDFTVRVMAGFATVPKSERPLVVAHSGVFRVLCGALGIAAPAAPIDNALPLLLSPPATASAPWSLERPAAAQRRPKQESMWKD